MIRISGTSLVAALVLSAWSSTARAEYLEVSYSGSVATAFAQSYAGQGSELKSVEGRSFSASFLFDVNNPDNFGGARLDVDLSGVLQFPCGGYSGCNLNSFSYAGNSTLNISATGVAGYVGNYGHFLSFDHLFGGGDTLTADAGDFRAVVRGDDSGWVNLTLKPDQSTLIFTSVLPVPIPASAPMFGAAVLALAGFGCGLKRRSRLAAG